MPSTPRINYTSRTFEVVKEAFRTHLMTKFPNVWRSAYESDVGMAWLEIVAYGFDILSFYIDYVANEVFLPTAQDRRSIINLGKMVGYKLSPPSGASVTCTASIDTIYGDDVIIPAGTPITSKSGLPFITLIEQRILAGQQSADVVLVHGEQQIDAFESDGTSFQRFKLTRTPVVDGSIEVTVNAIDWDEYDSLIYASASDNAYAVWYDEDDYGYIEFGDDDSGQIPPVDADIEVTYRVGGGVTGNVDYNQIQTNVQGETDEVIPVPVTVAVVNDIHRGSGGEDRETEEHARFWIPHWVSANGRAVTEWDFDTLATAYSGGSGRFAFAKAKLRQEIPELNTVDVYVWTRDDSGAVVRPDAGDALITALQTYFDNDDEGAVRLICVNVEVLPGYVVYIDVDFTLTVGSQYSSTDTSSAAQEGLDDLFASEDNRPGEDFHLSNVYNALHDALGVVHALVNEVTAYYKSTEVIDVGDGGAAYLGTVTVESGLPIVPKTVLVYDEDANYLVTDVDGEGILTGDGNGTVNYDTGAITVTFSGNVVVGRDIECDYGHVLDFARAEDVDTADLAQTRFTGKLSYPPITPFTGAEKGAVFSIGAVNFRSDADGDLVGVGLNPAGNNIIDHDTGYYDFTLTAGAAADAALSAAYYQKLQTPSEDIPVTKLQLPVKGNYTVSTQTETEADAG